MFIKLCTLCLALCVALPAFADDELAKKLDVGTWTDNPRYLTFGNYNGHALKWRILEVYSDKTAFLVLEDVLREKDGTVITMDFDADTVDSPNLGTNNFPASDICLWLNNTFANSLAPYQAGILDTEYGPDTAFSIEHPEDKYKWHGDKQIGKSKIFLLSVDDVINPKYFAAGDKMDNDLSFSANSDRDAGVAYWLRSPGYNSYEAARVVTGGKVLDFGVEVFNSNAIRPALKIDLSSPAIFAYGEAVFAKESENK
jgi:hypothetical protein